MTTSPTIRDANPLADLAAHEIMHHLGAFAHAWLPSPDAEPARDDYAMIELWADEGVAVGATSPISVTAAMLWEGLANRGSRNCVSETDLEEFERIVHSNTRQDHTALRLGHVIAAYAHTYDLARRLAATVQPEVYGVYGLPLRPLFDAIYTPLRQVLLRELHAPMNAVELTDDIAVHPPKLDLLSPVCLLAPAGPQAEHLLSIYDSACKGIANHVTAH